MSDMTVVDAARLAGRVGPENGWTDTPEEILGDNDTFRLLGRWFVKTDDGLVESLE